MEHEDYIKKLEELKRKAERAIVENMPGIEKEVLQFLSDYMDEKFDTKDGNFVANENAKKALNNFTDIMTAAISELKDYKGAVGQYLKNFKDVSTLMQEYQTGNGVNVKQARLGATQELVVSEIINQYSENGLNPGFVQPLRELLFDNITGGLNKKQAMAQLRDFIASGKDTTGKLHRYLEQTAQQGVDSYTGATNVRIMQTFKIETLIVSGSLISTSSPQCRLVINKMDALLDRKDWPKVKELAENNGLIEDTTFDNLPINKLHWGCRHEFTPVTLTQKQRDKLTSTPTNPAGGDDTTPRQKPTRPTAPKLQPIAPAFVPAKTIKEAEYRIREIGIKEVNLSKLTAEQSNTVLETVLKEHELSPLKIAKLDTYRKSSSPSGALYSQSNNSISINASHIKSFIPKKIQTFEEKIGKIDEVIDKYKTQFLGNPKYDQRKTKSRILQMEQDKRRLELRIKNEDKPKHFTFTEAGKNADESFQMLVTHEIGHYRHLKQLGENTYFNSNKNLANTDYGTTNHKEFFAEWYVQYRFKGPEGVPKDLLDLFKKL